MISLESISDDDIDVHDISSCMLYEKKRSDLYERLVSLKGCESEAELSTHTKVGGSGS